MNNHSKPRILIVDDEEDIASVMKKGLEQGGFSVTTFNDPLEALSNFKPGAHDLLLLDIKMPGMSGFELYRKMREIDPNVKICFITAFEIYYDEFKRVFPKIKVSCFVRKPVSIAELTRTISEELDIQQQALPIEGHRRNPSAQP